MSLNSERENASTRRRRLTRAPPSPRAAWVRRRGWPLLTGNVTHPAHLRSRVAHGKPATCSWVWFATMFQAPGWAPERLRPLFLTTAPPRGRAARSRPGSFPRKGQRDVREGGAGGPGEAKPLVMAGKPSRVSPLRVRPRAASTLQSGARRLKAPVHAALALGHEWRPSTRARGSGSLTAISPRQAQLRDPNKQRPWQPPAVSWTHVLLFKQRNLSSENIPVRHISQLCLGSPRGSVLKVEK